MFSIGDHVEVERSPLQVQLDKGVLRRRLLLGAGDFAKLCTVNRYKLDGGKLENDDKKTKHYEENGFLRIEGAYIFDAEKWLIHCLDNSLGQFGAGCW
jgi:hypothetical protein